MKLDVHRRLGEIATAQGKGYGKLVQKLLAIAFLEAGAEYVTERSVQGIDLEIGLAAGRRIAMEVKTSEPGAPGEVSFGKKDIQGLVAHLEKGFLPYFGVLGNRLLDDWIFAAYQPGEIRSDAKYSPTHLRPYRDPDLEALVAATFPEAVVRHARRAEEGGQGALDEILHGYDAFRVP